MVIVSSTYWYPEYKGDIHATYVHDINRHYKIVDKKNKVIVVTPNYGNSVKREEMDGVIVERFDFKVPLELSSGKVAQTKVNVFQKFRRIFTMGFYVLKNFYYTYKFAKEYNADVIHAHWVIPSGFPAMIAAKLLGKPCFITMHGGDVYYNKEEGYTFPKLWYIKPVLKFTLHHATKLTAITNDCRIHALNAGAYEKDVTIITNGADIRRFSRKNSSGGETIRKKYGLKGKKIIFTCRQLIPRKGIRYLIMAMPYIIKKHPKVKLLIAGDGMEREYLEKLIDKLKIKDYVSLLGWIKNDELPAYYNVSDIAVMPSLEEGFGIPAAEAMACELPVVSTDAGGLVEVVENNKTGLIVQKGNEKELAGAIIKFLDQPALGKKMGKDGRKKAETEFSWDKTAEKFLSLFNLYI
jgi:L-malate glycosyltransferase